MFLGKILDVFLFGKVNLFNNQDLLKMPHWICFIYILYTHNTYILPLCYAFLHGYINPFKIRM